MVCTILSFTPPTRKLINVLGWVNLVIINSGNCIGVLPIDFFGVRGYCCDFGFGRLDGKLTKIFIDFFVRRTEHPNEEIMSIVMGMGLFEVVADDTAIFWFDGSTSFFGDAILMIYSTEF